MIKGVFLYGTTNRGKLREALAVASQFGIELQDLNSVVQRSSGAPPPTVVEDCATYEGNALRKAFAYAQWAQMSCFADDTGIEIEELAGYPGVHTARVGVAALMSRLVPGRVYAARFVCCVAYTESSGRHVSVTASLPGTFVPSAAGIELEAPFEFSPFFVPDGESRSLRDLLAAGYSDSHRARALKALLGAL